MLAFYAGLLGFEEYFRLPADGEPGYVGLRLADSRLAIVDSSSPRRLLGLEIASGARFELWLYVDDVDTELDRLREAGVTVLREADDMPWGERLAYVADPEGNPVALGAGGD
jgi:lactoylglutathione lyase